MRQPHTVMVTPRTTKRTAHGTEIVPSGPTVPLQCRFRVVSSAEFAIAGEVVTYRARLLTTNPWPGGDGDTYALVEYEGIEYEVVGIPLVRDGSSRTKHTQVNLDYVTQPKRA